MNKELSSYISVMYEAIENGDFKTYEHVRGMLDEAVEENRRKHELMKEMDTCNFGVLNHIFEQELPTLIKTNKKAVKNVIKTIKEDKNLRGQFRFYNVIKEQYNGDIAKLNLTPMVVLEKVAKIVTKEVDKNTVIESNKKLRKVMKESGIKPSSRIDEETMGLYNSGHMILTEKSTITNTIPLMESFNNVCKYMEAHKDDKGGNANKFDEMIREFEDKIETNLNESELNFVKMITEFGRKTPVKIKKEAFERTKEDCLRRINEMGASNSENAPINELKKQLNSMKFNESTLVNDVTKLLEIQSVLEEE